MKNDILYLIFIFTPVHSDQGMNKKRVIICHLQLLIKDHGNKNNLLNINKELYRIFMESRLQYYEPIIKLGNVAIIIKLRDIEGIDLDAFIKGRNYRII